ncbi:MAG TPA: DUF5316 family protein [Bacillaceae bacterium]
MRFLKWGTLLSLLTVLLAARMWGMETGILIAGGMGLLALLLSAVMSGALASADRTRSGFAADSAEDRGKRNTQALRLALLSLPHFALALVFYFLNG